MRHILLTWLSALWLMLSLQAQAAPTQASNILILGDSLSAGFMMQKGEEWPALLQIKITAAQLQYHIINASISGDTTLGGLSRIQSLLKKHQPSWLIIELGANDGLQGLSLRKMHDNLNSIIQLAHKNNSQVLLIGMHIPPNYGKRYSRSFYENYLHLQQQHKLSFIPFLLEGIAGTPELNLSDGIHPIAAAQPLIVNNIWPTLQPLLTPTP